VNRAGAQHRRRGHSEELVTQLARERPLGKIEATLEPEVGGRVAGMSD
jgi:hypothetical protein